MTVSEKRLIRKREFYDSIWQEWLLKNREGKTWVERIHSIPSIRYEYDFFKENLYARISMVLENGMRILDMGCGAGNDLETTKKIFPNVQCYGLDISTVALRSANKSDSPIFFVVGDSLNTPFKYQIFDITICSEVLEHLSFADQKRLLREIHDLLKPDGKLFLTTPNKQCILLKIAYILRKIAIFRICLRINKAEIYRSIDRIYDKYGMHEHIHEVSPNEVKKMLYNSGFTHIKIIGGATVVLLEILYNRSRLFQYLWNKITEWLPLYLKRSLIIECVRPIDEQ